MPDRLTPAERSRLMGRIRSKDTKPERVVRSLLHGLRYRYRLHARDLPGTPDIVFRGRRKAIFVHGCFWHSHPGCSRAFRPNSRADFWAEKLGGNATRDALALQSLAEAGWETLVVWECEVPDRDALSAKLVRFLASPSSTR